MTDPATDVIDQTLKLKARERAAVAERLLRAWTSPTPISMRHGPGRPTPAWRRMTAGKSDRYRQRMSLPSNGGARRMTPPYL